MINPCSILLVMVLLWRKLLNSGGSFRKRNSEDWELNEGKESGIEPKFDCVKSFMNTDAFQKFSTNYGLDSEIGASFCESFATHVDLP